jgi:hypothetical protein
MPIGNSYGQLAPESSKGAAGIFTVLQVAFSQGSGKLEGSNLALVSNFQKIQIFAREMRNYYIRVLGAWVAKFSCLKMSNYINNVQNLSDHKRKLMAPTTASSKHKILA